MEEKPGGQSHDAQMKTSDAIRWERGPGTEVGQAGRAQGWGYFAAVSVVFRWVISGWIFTQTPQPGGPGPASPPTAPSLPAHPCSSLLT